MQEDNYYKSNNITNIPNLRLSPKTKLLYFQYRGLIEITENALQALSDSICKDLGLVCIDITFAGIRPHKRLNKFTTNEIYGKHGSGKSWSSIRIYKLTAKRRNLVSAKSAIDTLIHEICHDIDINILQLQSIHTKGFYSRIKHLHRAMY